MTASRTIRCTICGARPFGSCLDPSGRPMLADHPQRELEAREAMRGEFMGKVRALLGVERTESDGTNGPKGDA